MPIMVAMLALRPILLAFWLALAAQLAAGMTVADPLAQALADSVIDCQPPVSGHRPDHRHHAPDGAALCPLLVAHVLPGFLLSSGPSLKLPVVHPFAIAGAPPPARAPPPGIHPLPPARAPPATT